MTRFADGMYCCICTKGMFPDVCCDAIGTVPLDI